MARDRHERRAVALCQLKREIIQLGRASGGKEEEAALARIFVFTCLWGLISGQPNNRDAAQGDLSPCLQCDEVLCGPAFVECAGANRRRCGITSDISRANSEVCNLTATT